jgi:hypothetical protein
MSFPLARIVYYLLLLAIGAGIGFMVFDWFRTKFTGVKERRTKIVMAEQKVKDKDDDTKKSGLTSAYDTLDKLNARADKSFKGLIDEECRKDVHGEAFCLCKKCKAARLEKKK